MSFLGAQNSIALGVQGLIHIDTGVVGSADYLLAKSLRFRSSASAYLNRTVSAAVSTYTVSMWVKRGTLTSTYQYLFSHPNSANNDGYGLAYNQTTDTMYYYNGTTYATTAAYRDPAAWYHIVFVNNAGAFTLYINGSSILTGTATTIPSGAVMNLGRWYSGISSGFYFDGEMAEINFVDGQALAPTAFGAYSTYNQWLPIKYAGTYGTNGFYLPFTNTTSTSTLVADSSPNGNNWTPNNISLTAGSTYDSLTDVPTLTSATVANYAVLNPLANGGGTLSNGNLTLTSSSAVWGTRLSTIAVTSGKWYFEVTIQTPGTSGFMVGVTQNSAPTSHVGFDANGYGYYDAGTKYNNNVGTAYGSAMSANDVIGVAFDATAGTLTFYKNNVSQGVAFSSLTGAYKFGVWAAGSAGTGCSFNFGQRPFSYTPPTGFVALNTYNLPTPTILQGNLYMDATLWTGNGPASQVIVNQAQFKPDLVWVKNRSSTRKNLFFNFSFLFKYARRAYSFFFSVDKLAE